MTINMDALMQVLGAAGAGLNPDPWVQNVNALVQSGYGSKKQLDLVGMIRQMISGEFGEDSKMSADGKGLKFQFGSKILGDMLGGETPGMGAPTDTSPKLLAEGLPGAQAPSVPTPSMPNLPEQKGGFLGGLLNPSVSQSGVSAAALAGLTPQDVSSALSGALNIEQLKQKQITDVADMLYKGALTQESLARTREIGEGDPLDRNFPIPHPEAGNLSLRQWQSLPTEEREFSAYVHAAKKLGAPKEELTRKFFMTLEPTDREQFLRAAMDDPKLMTAAQELAKSGATRITLGEKVEQKKAFGALEGQLYFKDPKWIDDLSKHMSSKGVRSATLFADDPDLAKAEEKVRFIESKISAGGGTIQEVKLAEDGKTMIWTVKWPSGDVETIRYAVRD